MPTWITALLQLFGFGAKIASKNQDIMNSPEMKKAKIAQQDQAELDQIHKSTQKADIESARDDFSH